MRKTLSAYEGKLLLFERDLGPVVGANEDIRKFVEPAPRSGLLLLLLLLLTLLLLLL